MLRSDIRRVGAQAKGLADEFSALLVRCVTTRSTAAVIVTSRCRVHCLPDDLKLLEQTSLVGITELLERCATYSMLESFLVLVNVFVSFNCCSC